MDYGNVIHCHDKEPTPSRSTPHWLAPDAPYGEQGYRNYRICSYCSCIHPEDLLAAFHRGGVTMQLIDQRYGLNQRFEVQCISNPDVGKTVKLAHMRHRETSESDWVEYDQFGPAPETLTATFNPIHLLDLDPEAFASLSPFLK